MAMLGIILTVVFSIIAVTKKAADLDDKLRHSHGQIIRSALKSVIIILTMSLAVNITIATTNTLMVYVSAVLNSGDTLTEKNEIVYTDEQFATMGRIMNIVGNYSLNPSYNNRYNLMNCYNDIRGELKRLADDGVFSFDYNAVDENNKAVTPPQEEVGFRYETLNSEGKEVKTWQSLLQKLAGAGDYNTDMALDSYNEGVANALVELMTEMKTNTSFSALESYTRSHVTKAENIGIDRILFLSGTFGWGNQGAARTDGNMADNKASLFDQTRYPYYTGEKDMYDVDKVNEDFYVNVSRMNYFMIYLVGMAIIVNMAVIIANCIVRLFNLLFLYIIAPPIIAVTPLDDGAKFKQWLTAFIVQAFSVFATVISMRLFLIFIPIVMRGEFRLSDSTVLNILGKLVMIWAGTIAIQKANGLLTGILADNAGMQSIMAGSMENDVKSSTVGKTIGAFHEKAQNKVGSFALGTAKFGVNAATLLARPYIGAVVNAGKNVAYGWNKALKWTENSILASPEYRKQKREEKVKDLQEEQVLEQAKKQPEKKKPEKPPTNNPPPPPRTPHQI